MSDIINVPMAQQRDIKTVTAEIRTLTEQGQRLALEYAIEIGRRLKEAKSMLPHGEWGRWLKEEVEFSQSSAGNFMRIFEEYGADQISIFGAEAKSQALGKLTYTKALKLLAMPAEEREEFVEQNPVEQMSTRELEKAIRERDEAREGQNQAESRAREAEARAKEADAEARKAAKAAETEAKTAKEQLEKARRELEAALKAEAEAKKQAEKVRAAEEKAQAAEERAEELRKKIAASSPETAQFKIVFDMVQQDFNRLNGILLKVQENDPETGKKLEGALKAVLENMLGRLRK